VAYPDAASIGAVFLATLSAYVSTKYVTYSRHQNFVNAKQVKESRE
jgi:hypothetical protein